MPIYHHLGQLPPKRHTQFRQPDGSLYHEQLFGTVGFDGMSSLLYHLRPPTQVRDVVGKIGPYPPDRRGKNPHRPQAHRLRRSAGG